MDDPAAALYAMPAAYLANAAGWWANGVRRTDEVVADAARPAVLQGYTPFDYEATESALLRVDLYFSHYSDTEGLGFMDEGTFAYTVATFAWYARLHRALVAADNDVDQWVSIRLDLVTGRAYAWEIDAYGNPLVDYGQFAVMGEDSADVGSVATILKLASDGDLYPLLYDDTILSYMALYGITKDDGSCR